MIVERTEILFEQGDIVIYEGRKCKIESITKDQVELRNLDKRDGDWTMLKVKIESESQDYNDFFEKIDQDDPLARNRLIDEAN